MSDLEFTSVNVLAANSAKWSAMSVEELRDELARALTITADALMYLAGVWRELESRGEDLSDLATGIGAYLPLIASGKLAAQAVVAFIGRKTVLRMIATLPTEKQLALASGEHVAVVTEKNGLLTTKEMPVLAMPVSLALRVFEDGRIRSPEDQARFLGKHRGRTRGRREAPDPVRMRPLDPSDVLTAPHLQYLSSKKLVIPVSESEQMAIRDNAAAAGMPIGVFIRSVLFTSGALTPAVKDVAR